MLEAASGVCQQYSGFFLRRRASLSHCFRRVLPPEEQVSCSLLEVVLFVLLSFLPVLPEVGHGGLSSGL